MLSLPMDALVSLLRVPVETRWACAVRPASAARTLLVCTILLLAPLAPPSLVGAEPLDVELGPGSFEASSLDGSRILLRPIPNVMNRSLPLGRLLSVPIEGGSAADLTPPGTPIWRLSPRVLHLLPDGTRALIETERSGLYEMSDVYVASLDGDEFRKLPCSRGDALRGPITPDQTRIICGAWNAGGKKVFATPIDGGTPIRLDTPLGLPSFRGLQISPENDMLLGVTFRLSDEEGDEEAIALFSSPLSGAPSTVLADLRIHEDPEDDRAPQKRFTPDGRRVVYSLEGVLYSVNATGGTPVKLAESVEQFAITADSAHGIYAASDGALYRVPIVGGEPSRLTPAAAGGAVSIWEITPDGDRVVFVQDVGFGPALFSVSVRGRTPVPTRLTAEAGSAVSVWDMTPDGDRVVFVQDIGSGPALFSVSIQGGPPTLLDGRGASSFRLSPDAEWVVYVAAQDGGVYSTRIDGGAVIRLGGPGGFLITPDGSRVVLQPRSGDRALELHSVPIEGGVVTRLTRPLGPDERISVRQISPDNRHAIFTVVRRMQDPLGPGCVRRRSGTQLCPPSAPGLPLRIIWGRSWNVPILHSARLPPVVYVDIDPQHAGHRIRLGNEGWVSVAILGSDEVAVEELDIDTLAFGPAGALADRKIKLVDVDGDGFTDLVTRYRRDETGLASSDVQACLSGSYDDFEFRSCDDIVATSR